MNLTQNLRVCHCSTLNISKTVQDRDIVILLNANRKSYAVYQMVLSSVALTDPNHSFQGLSNSKMARDRVILTMVD